MLPGAHQIPVEAPSANRNYELASDHFKDIKGYEHYQAQAARRQPANYNPGQAWVDNCIWGTPDQCITKIQKLADAFHPDEFMLTGRYGSMPHDVSQRSLELFGREVVPAVHEMPVLEPITYTVGGLTPGPLGHPGGEDLEPEAGQHVEQPVGRDRQLRPAGQGEHPLRHDLQDQGALPGVVSPSRRDAAEVAGEAVDQGLRQPQVVPFQLGLEHGLLQRGVRRLGPVGPALQPVRQPPAEPSGQLR